MRKEIFPTQMRSKFMPREDEPFQIIEKINDSAYKMKLLNEYSVSATFNVSDLSLFNVGDNLRENPFEERGKNMIPSFNIKRSIRGSIGPLTRFKAKRFKETINGLLQET